MTEQTNNQTQIPDLNEQEFQQKLDRDEFQKELDLCIQEKRLADLELPLYELDAPFYIHEIESQGVKYQHKVKNPTDTDEIRKEAMSIIVRRNAGKLKGDDLVETFSDNSRARKRYYDGTAVEVWGYGISESTDPETWQPVITVIAPAEDLTADEIAEFNVGKDKQGNLKDLTLLDTIPEADRLKVASLIHGGNCVVINEKGKRIRSVRTKREYIVKQLFGVKADDNGTLSKPTNVIAYHFKEAGAEAIGKFETQAINVKTWLKHEDQPEEHRVISIGVCKELFAKHIQYIQGASINNAEVLGITSGDERLKAIPAAVQRDAVFVYFRFLKD